MKKTYLLLLLVSLFSFTSCTDDDDSAGDIILFSPNDYTFDKNGGEVVLKLINKDLANWQFDACPLPFICVPWIDTVGYSSGEVIDGKLVLPDPPERTKEELEYWEEYWDKYDWFEVAKLINGDIRIQVDENTSGHDRTIWIYLTQSSKETGYHAACITIWQTKD